MAIRIGLIGYGRAGKAVASVFESDAKYELVWVYKRLYKKSNTHQFVSSDQVEISDLLTQQKVDIIVDFSSGKCITDYGLAAAEQGINILSAVSHYTDSQYKFLTSLSQKTTVFWSPNITLGVNFLLRAAKQLKALVPNVDIEIIEEHFKGKTETSGTAKKIAEAIGVEAKNIKSIRAGGIIGKHEIIFGFPYQTVRLTHEAIAKEAFGMGAAFVAEYLIDLPKGLYSFDDIMTKFLKGVDDL